LRARPLGVLLAGGRGERLGLGLPKALASLAGATLLERALATLAAVCDEVLVTAPPEVAGALGIAGVVPDVEGAGGPLAGLVAGLNARPFERAIALAVDLPLLGPADLAVLLATGGHHAAVLPAPGGVPQPLAAVYGAAAAAPLAARLAAGERSVTGAVGTLGPLLLGDDALWIAGIAPRAFHNVNTPEELAAAARLLAGGGGA
jgi:molybdopterin-guanine dinucleotide biosynthesis protein A